MLLIHAEEFSFTLVIDSDNAQAVSRMYYEILTVFNAKFEDGIGLLPRTQTCSANLLNGIDGYVDKYKSVVPQIYQLKKHFQKLPVGHKFFTFWGIDQLSDDEILNLSFSLSEMNESDFCGYSENVKHLRFVLDHFEIRSVSPPIYIGESQRDRRVCRFCRKRMPEVSFRNKAHAITEALGNKNIILREECDSCNEQFGRGIEEALISFLGPFRSIFGVKGKNGHVKSVSSESVIEYDEESKSVKITVDENFESPEKGIELVFDSNKKISAQDIYRCFVKFALSMIDDYEYDQFEDTVKWIRKKKNHTRFPLVASALSNKALEDAPDATIFKRKVDDVDIPLYLCELNIICFKYVFIIPLVKGQACDFIARKNFMAFWDRLDHYKHLKWSFYDMSDDAIDNFTLNIILGGPENTERGE